MENIDKLNNLINYIENNLDQNISNEKMSKILGVNSYALYSIHFECTATQLKELAPEFWKIKKSDNIVRKILVEYTCYGVIQYDENYSVNNIIKYHIASNKQIPNSCLLKIPSSKWAVFELKSVDIENYNGNYFNAFSHYVYSNWIPYSNYNIKSIPELEVYYPDGKIEWWLPIE